VDDRSAVKAACIWRSLTATGKDQAVPLVHFGEMSMFGIRRLSAIIVMFGTAMLQPAHAVELTGVWASQGELCKFGVYKERQ
jgi:hypothetical protein